MTTMGMSKMRRRWAITVGALAAILAAAVLLASSATGAGSPARTGSHAANHHAVFVRAKIYKHGKPSKVRVRPVVHRSSRHHGKAGRKPPHHSSKKGQKAASHAASSPVAGDSGTVK